MKVCVLCCVLLLSNAMAQSKPTAPDDKDTKNLPYSLRAYARSTGNVGAWWKLLNENEKAAFLDGYQTAMKESYLQIRAVCKVLKDEVKPSSDQQAFTTQVGMAIGICGAANDFDGFEKIATQGLDDFYSDRTNQAIELEWTLSYLRDKALNTKTEGQLLDTLRAKQKDVHDCSKHPYICKLGADEAQPPK